MVYGWHMRGNAAALRVDKEPVPDLSPEDLGELRTRSLSAAGALARGECVDMDVLLAELDEISASR
jgi:hypothetical protein